MRRDPSAEGGFAVIPYEQAIRETAEAIQRIQSAQGNDAMAVLTGASLTSETSFSTRPPATRTSCCRDRSRRRAKGS